MLALSVLCSVDMNTTKVLATGVAGWPSVWSIVCYCTQAQNSELSLIVFQTNGLSYTLNSHITFCNAF